MVSDFWDNGIKLQTMEPHHAIFNKDDICVGCIFESEVIDNAADHDLDYDESLKILSKELIKDYIKESKKSKEVVH